MPAELPLVPSAIALAISALLLLSPRGGLSRPIGIAFVVIACVTPIALHAFVDPERSRGRALWEWTAVGGPLVQASYRVDDLAAIAIALTTAFTGAALAVAGRTERRHPALGSLILALGLISIALVVTDDLVASIVVLAVVGIVTGLALFAAAPVAATARAVAYLSLGIQAWVLAALLVSRQGNATFDLTQISPDSISPGAILAATLGALLFAGLYPAVAWSVGPGAAATDPGQLGRLIAMPAGISASLLLLRLLAASGLEPVAIALPEIGADVRLALAVMVLAVVAVALVRGGRVTARTIGAGAVAIVVLAALPLFGWAHAVLVAAILTTAYATAAVSLALPEEWETVRSGLALVVLWIGIATASPLAVAGGAVALFARAAAALVSTLWLVPHRDHLAFVTGSSIFLVGAVAAGVGAATSDDLPLALLGSLAAAAVVALEIVQLARRDRTVKVPRALDVASAAAAALVAVLAALLAVPMVAAMRTLFPAAPPPSLPQIVVVAALAAATAVLARTVRPLLPYFELAAEQSGPAIRALDPAPIAMGTFRVLEVAATRGGAAFAAFERRGGVWLATLLIVALLLWSVR
jgi:hypothetical protein